MADQRLVFRSIDGSDRGFVVQSTAALTWDDATDPKGGTLDELAERLAAKAPDRIVVHVHGYNNPAAVAEGRVRKAWEGYFETADEGTVYLGFLWPSEMGLRPWLLLKGLPVLAYVIALLGLVAMLFGESHPSVGLGSLGGFLVGLIGVLALLRWAAYHRDHYRATEYGVPDLVETIRVIDARLSEVCDGNGVELSFIGHSMGSFVVTSAVRILVEAFHAVDTDLSVAERRERLSSVGRSFRLANLVLISPDIPVQALVSTRVNFLASSLRRFHGRFLFSNVGDVVLDPIAVFANSHVLPIRGDHRNARLGNLGVLPESGKAAGGFYAEVTPDEYQHRLRTPHGLVRDLVIQAGTKPTVPVEPENAFMVFDCTGVRGPRLAMADRTQFWIFERILMLVGYALRVAGLPVGQDVHAGYFNHPEVSKALYGAAEFGEPLRHTERSMALWAADHGVRVLAVGGAAQVTRATGESTAIVL